MPVPIHEISAHSRKLTGPGGKSWPQKPLLLHCRSQNHHENKRRSTVGDDDDVDTNQPDRLTRIELIGCIGGRRKNEDNRTKRQSVSVRSAMPEVELGGRGTHPEERSLVEVQISPLVHFRATVSLKLPIRFCVLDLLQVPKR